MTKYKDRQLFPAGDYTNQSLGGAGIKSWVEGREAVRDEDIVIWHTFGLTHLPRVEDFPIMPAEIVQLHLSPLNFCAFVSCPRPIRLVSIQQRSAHVLNCL